MPIIISKGGHGARRIDPSGIGLESDLQEYIHNNPECLPVYEIEEDLRLLILAREVPTSSGPIDALGVDQKGNLYIIETKLYRNTDKRHVLSQVLDYGAALWANAEGGTHLVDRLEGEVERHFRQSLREKISAFFKLEDDEAVTALLDTVRQCVTGGRFRFVVMMDKLDERLKDLIKFVNHNSQFDVYGVELDFYRFEDYEILIPRLYGAEVRKASGSPTVRAARKWSEPLFFEEAAAVLSPEHLSAVRRLYDYCRSKGVRVDWGAAINGSYIPRFEISGTTVSPFYVMVSGHFYLKAKWHRDDPAAGPIAATFAQAFRRLFPKVPEKVMDFEGTFPPAEWTPHVEGIEKAIDEMLQLHSPHPSENP